MSFADAVDSSESIIFSFSNDLFRNVLEFTENLIELTTEIADLNQKKNFVRKIKKRREKKEIQKKN